MKKSSSYFGFSFIFLAIAIGFFCLAFFLIKISFLKWVLFLLSSVIFVFSIGGFYVAYKERKKENRKEDIASFFVNQLEKKMNDSSFKNSLKELEQKRDTLTQKQEFLKDDYGYSLLNPIMTSGVTSSTNYLDRLRTEDDQSFTWTRDKAISLVSLHGVNDVIVDEYTLYLDEKEYTTIYVCPWGHNSSYVPKGLHLSN